MNENLWVDELRKVLTPNLVLLLKVQNIPKMIEDWNKRETNIEKMSKLSFMRFFLFFLFSQFFSPRKNTHFLYELFIFIFHEKENCFSVVSINIIIIYICDMHKSAAETKRSFSNENLCCDHHREKEKFIS